MQFFRDHEIRATLAVFVLVSFFIITTFLTMAFPWVVFWPMFSIAGFLILLHPRAGLFSIMLLTMIWERYFTLQSLVVSGRIVKLYPLDIILMMTFIAFVLHWFVERHRRKLLHDPHASSPSLLAHFGAFEKMLLLFALFSAVYFFRSQIAGVREPDIGFSTFKNYAFYMLLTFLVLGLIRTRADYRRLVGVVLLGGVGILVFVAIGLVRGSGLWTEYVPLSTEGVRYLAFPHAFYITMAMLILIGAVAHRAVRSVRAASVCLALQGIGLIGSLMRHLWLAFLFGIGILITTAPSAVKRRFLRWGYWTVIAMIGAAIFLAGAALFFSESILGAAVLRYVDTVVVRAQSLVHIRDISALWRLRLWGESIRLFFANPIFGIGFGREIIFTFQEWTSTVRIRELHNSMLSLLIQTGIVGFSFFVMIQVALVRGYVQTRQNLGRVRPWADGAFAAYGAFLFASLFQPYFEINIVGIFFWLILGMVRVAPFLADRSSFDASYLRRRRHLQMLESAHTRGHAYG